MTKQYIKPPPINLDPEILADQERVFEGDFSTGSMQRLTKMLHSIPPSVYIDLKFTRGALELPMISGQLSVTLRLKCERCLDTFDIEINSNFDILIKLDTMNIEGQIDSLEYYEYDGKSLDLSKIIEDELILSVPLVPKHLEISQCNQDMLVWLASNKGAVQKIDNPFARLKRKLTMENKDGCTKE